MLLDLRVKGSLGAGSAINIRGEFWQDARGDGKRGVSQTQKTFSNIPILADSILKTQAKDMLHSYVLRTKFCFTQQGN